MGVGAGAGTAQPHRQGSDPKTWPDAFRSPCARGDGALGQRRLPGAVKEELGLWHLPDGPLEMFPLQGQLFTLQGQLFTWQGQLFPSGWEREGTRSIWGVPTVQNVVVGLELDGL